MIIRQQYRSKLKTSFPEVELLSAIDQCKKIIENKIESEEILTASLYYYDLHLFFHCEYLEKVEDISLLLEPLSMYLMTWPGLVEERLWVPMDPIYWHNIPGTLEEWKRNVSVEKRRGRIAKLKDDKLFSYIYYHKAIVDEGLLKGDKYHYISLHENILFSYFEEPKIMLNILNDDTRESKIIDEWLAINPESHFEPLEGSSGSNFMFIPAYFTL